MNFKDMPELGFEYAYPTVLGIMLAVCVILHWRFRKNGWL
jgi:magnesium transporter